MLRAVGTFGRMPATPLGRQGGFSVTLALALHEDGMTELRAGVLGLRNGLVFFATYVPAITS